MSRLSHIAELAAIFKHQGMEHVIICPGSRNAPLIQVFYSQFKKACISIVDERSAGYFALGLALKTHKPVAIITTSGTAVLNLGPAITEAFHQGVPLIALTADRPVEWTDQQDNQSIRQTHLFETNCKASFTLPVQANVEEDLWFTNRIANQSYLIANQLKKGPVHINVPLREPLYETIPLCEHTPRIIQFTDGMEFKITEEVLEKWNTAKKILIVVGQEIPNKQLNENLNRLTLDSRVVVLSELIGNISGKYIITNPEALIKSCHSALLEATPDLVIYLGGQIVSRDLKEYLRSISSAEFWQIGQLDYPVDTYKKLCRYIKSTYQSFLEALPLQNKERNENSFSEMWLSLYDRGNAKMRGNIQNIPFSDFWLFSKLSERISADDVLFIGNSSAIRYFQYFKCLSKAIYSNRGTSGIDGCLSTASGIASAESRKLIAIVGDLSFIYDSNGLWNKMLPDNLKIIVINNSGGNIFRMIPGPSEQAGFESFFEAHHPVSIEKLSLAYGLKHFTCAEEQIFAETYNEFYNCEKAAVFEVQTNKELNIDVFSNFVKNLKTDE